MCQNRGWKYRQMQGVSNTITVVDGIDLKIHVDLSCGLADRALLRRVPV